MENNTSNQSTTPVLKVWLEFQLEKRAQEDALFAETLKKPNKSIEGCVKYIFSQARKCAEGNCSAIWHTDVLEWAIHYYDEDDIKVETKNSVAPKVETKKETRTQPTKATKKTEKPSAKAKKEVKANPLLSNLKKKTKKTEEKMSAKQTATEEWTLFS